MDPKAEDEALLDHCMRTGCTAIIDRGLFWRSFGLRMFRPLPCTGAIRLSDEDRKCLWNQGAVALRYPCEWNQPGIPSYIYLLNSKDYDIPSLSSSQRQNTRRGLERCTVEQVSVELVLRDGMELVPDTFKRQGRACTPNTIYGYQCFFESLKDNPLFEVWASFVERRLGACLVIRTYRGVAYFVAIFNRRELLRFKVMNALIFRTSRSLLDRESISSVSYGMRSPMGDSPGLNKFKASMGFERVGVCERVEINPLFRPIFDHGLARLITCIPKRLCHRSPWAQRSHGLMSTYLRQVPCCTPEMECVPFENITDSGS
jgi:hypothetical protein